MQMCKINGQNMKLDVIKDAEINEFCMKIVKSLSESPWGLWILILCNSQDTNLSSAVINK